MESVTTHEAKTHLSALLKRVEKGQEIEIMRGNLPVAKLVPQDSCSIPARPKVGAVTSERIKCSEDAFEPMSEKEMRDWGFS